MPFPGSSDKKESVYSGGGPSWGFLGWEDLLEKGMATHSIILTQEISWQITVHGVAKELDMV